MNRGPNFRFFLEASDTTRRVPYNRSIQIGALQSRLDLSQKNGRECCSLGPDRLKTEQNGGHFVKH